LSARRSLLPITPSNTTLGSNAEDDDAVLIIPSMPVASPARAKAVQNLLALQDSATKPRGNTEVPSPRKSPSNPRGKTEVPSPTKSASVDWEHLVPKPRLLPMAMTGKLRDDAGPLWKNAKERQVNGKAHQRGGIYLTTSAAAANWELGSRNAIYMENMLATIQGYLANQMLGLPPHLAHGSEVVAISLMEQLGWGDWHLEDKDAGEWFFVIVLGIFEAYEVFFRGPPGRSTESVLMRVESSGTIYEVDGDLMDNYPHRAHSDKPRIILRIGMNHVRLDGDFTTATGGEADSTPGTPGSTSSSGASTLARTNTGDSTLSNCSVPPSSSSQRRSQSTTSAATAADDAAREKFAREWAHEAMNTDACWEDVLPCLFVIEMHPGFDVDMDLFRVSMNAGRKHLTEQYKERILKQMREFPEAYWGKAACADSDEQDRADMYDYIENGEAFEFDDKGINLVGGHRGKHNSDVALGVQAGDLVLIPAALGTRRRHVRASMARMFKEERAAAMPWTASTKHDRNMTKVIFDVIGLSKPYKVYLEDDADSDDQPLEPRPPPIIVHSRAMDRISGAILGALLTRHGVPTPHSDAKRRSMAKKMYHASLNAYTHQTPSHNDGVDSAGPGNDTNNFNADSIGLYTFTSTRGNNCVARYVLLMPGDIVITSGALRYTWLHGVYRLMPGDDPAKWDIELTAETFDSARTMLCYRMGECPPHRIAEYNQMMLECNAKDEPDECEAVATSAVAVTPGAPRTRAADKKQAAKKAPPGEVKGGTLTPRKWLPTKILAVHPQMLILESLQHRQNAMPTFLPGMIFTLVVPAKVTTKGQARVQDGNLHRLKIKVYAVVRLSCSSSGKFFVLAIKYQEGTGRPWEGIFNVNATMMPPTEFYEHDKATFKPAPSEVLAYTEEHHPCPPLHLGRRLMMAVDPSTPLQSEQSGGMSNDEDETVASHDNTAEVSQDEQEVEEGEGDEGEGSEAEEDGDEDEAAWSARVASANAEGRRRATSGPVRRARIVPQTTRAPPKSNKRKTFKQQKVNIVSAKRLHVMKQQQTTEGQFVTDEVLVMKQAMATRDKEARDMQRDEMARREKADEYTKRLTAEALAAAKADRAQAIAAAAKASTMESQGKDRLLQQLMEERSRQTAQQQTVTNEQHYSQHPAYMNQRMPQYAQLPHHSHMQSPLMYHPQQQHSPPYHAYNRPLSFQQPQSYHHQYIQQQQLAFQWPTQQQQPPPPHNMYTLAPQDNSHPAQPHHDPPTTQHPQPGPRPRHSLMRYDQDPRPEPMPQQLQQQNQHQPQQYAPAGQQHPQQHDQQMGDGQREQQLPPHQYHLNPAQANNYYQHHQPNTPSQPQQRQGALYPDDAHPIYQPPREFD
jgi:hypothetical protein